MIDALSSIEITDADIEEIERLFGDVKFDDERRQILKHMESTDIQAFPGSGKTTVLVAKLAILAKKWPYTDKGICVLSHTNVARDEIEGRIGNTDIGRLLLSYPHFIGTVHSFFDTFVGLPWLRSNNYPVTMIDTESVLTRRYRKLTYGTQQYLSKINKSEYACESTSFPIALNLTCSDQTPSYKNIYAIIDQSFQEGYFTFDEMLHISKYAFEQCAYLSSAIQERFPLLFIDEAQDTNTLQWSLIDESFPVSGSSIRQSFGDANQAIFQSYNNEETGAGFPHGAYLSISNSHRFGEAIAQLADPLGVAAKGLTGTLSKYEKLNGKHTIFLFEQATDVLPAYAKYLLSCFTDEELNAGENCFAVGMVHTKNSPNASDKNYPIGVKDYFPAYDADTTRISSKPKQWSDFLSAGVDKFNKTNNYFSMVESIADGLRTYIRMNSKIELPNAHNAFNSLLGAIPADNQKSFREQLLAITELSTSYADTWSSIIELVRSLLVRFFGITKYASEFFQPTNNTGVSEELTVKANSNINTFSYHEGSRKVQIKLSSIHAVKGRTHLATLVLDTYWYKRNLKSIMPWLCNIASKSPSERDAKRLKCHYVAITRAKGLICLAAPKSSISDKDKTNLIKAGWNITEL